MISTPQDHWAERSCMTTPDWAAAESERSTFIQTWRQQQNMAEKADRKRMLLIRKMVLTKLKSSQTHGWWELCPSSCVCTRSSAHICWKDRWTFLLELPPPHVCLDKVQLMLHDIVRWVTFHSRSNVTWHKPLIRLSVISGGTFENIVHCLPLWISVGAREEQTHTSLTLKSGVIRASKAPEGLKSRVQRQD